MSIMTLPTREIDDCPVPSASRFSSASAEGVKCQVASRSVTIRLTSLAERRPVGAQPGLDVADRNAGLRGRQRRRHRRVRVAVDERRVGPEIVEAALHADEDLGGLLRVRARTDAEVHVGLGQAQLTEDGVRHVHVVVLPRVHDVLPHTSLGERMQHRRELHEVGARSNDVENVFHD